VTEAEANTKLDIRDSEYVWCTGIVTMKVMYISGPPSLKIHYEGWDYKYDEMLSMNDSRLAPLGFFTSREDIPKYILDGSGRCRSGYVVPGCSQDYNRYTKLIAELNSFSEDSESEGEEIQNEPE